MEKLFASLKLEEEKVTQNPTKIEFVENEEKAIKSLEEISKYKDIAIDTEGEGYDTSDPKIHLI